MVMSYHTQKVGTVNLFYREAGTSKLPTMLLLHGFPSAGHEFDSLIPKLEAHFHLLAPDLPGFGQTHCPEDFTYTFDHLTQVIREWLSDCELTHYYLYVFDYGAPIGFRLALENPQAILGITSQNGNIYREGLGKKWSARAKYWAHPTEAQRKFYESAFAPDTIINQYLTGTQPGTVSAVNYTKDIAFSAKGDYAKHQSDLIFDYQTNVALYPKFQAYLRQYQPKLLAAWGQNDPSFIPAGAVAFNRDDPNTRVELLDTGHFALETHADVIAKLIIETFDPD
ncbi:alpha/beta fold hydrolase [Lacticaseibacillus porcinae]|uniref:alpha/beta fold hydrolase n=1 Tax=Lacticaseibacillus porcinae TaxID=1123687 RepID=UPI001CDBC702|nr:alpha/beta hydrolase [Lacticaseibacillus porcinae]